MMSLDDDLASPVVEPASPHADESAFQQPSSHRPNGGGHRASFHSVYSGAISSSASAPIRMATRRPAADEIDESDLQGDEDDSDQDSIPNSVNSSTMLQAGPTAGSGRHDAKQLGTTSHSFGSSNEDNDSSSLLSPTDSAPHEVKASSLADLAGHAETTASGAQLVDPYEELLQRSRTPEQASEAASSPSTPSDAAPGTAASAAASTSPRTILDDFLSSHHSADPVAEPSTRDTDEAVEAIVLATSDSPVPSTAVLAETAEEANQAAAAAEESFPSVAKANASVFGLQPDLTLDSAIVHHPISAAQSAAAVSEEVAAAPKIVSPLKEERLIESNVDSVPPSASPSESGASAALSSSFSAHHAAALDALEALRRAVTDDVHQLALHAQHSTASFASSLASLRSQQAAAEAAVESLRREKEASRGKVDELKSSLAAGEARLASLTATISTLTAQRDVLLAARHARLQASWKEAQPLRDFLWNNEGSRVGAHRTFLKEERRRSRAADNLHVSDDEEDEKNDRPRRSAPLTEATPFIEEPLPPTFLPSSSTPFPRRYGRYTPSLTPHSVRLSLPLSVVEAIWICLGVKDLQAIAGVCRGWKNILEEGSGTWKLLLKRVSGVEKRLQQEKQREKMAKRGGGGPPAGNGVGGQPPGTPGRGGLERASTMANVHSNVPPPLQHGGSTSSLHAHPSPAAPEDPSHSGGPGSPARRSSGSTPGGDATPSTPGSGLLGGMLRRFRGNSNASAQIVPPSPAQSPAPLTQQAANGYQPMHLHYSLQIDLAARDTTSLVVTGSLARSTLDALRCADPIENESEKGQTSVTMHMCSLAHPTRPGSLGTAVSHLGEELEFCRQLFALQANLTQAKMEKSKILAQMDGDEGVKKHQTAINAELQRDLTTLEHEIESLRRQNESDELTRDFLAQQLLNMQASRQHEQERTEAARRERAEKDEAAARELHAREEILQQQTEIFAQLRSQKKQITREVKSMQLEVEREKAEKRKVQEEYDSLVATLAKLKGGSSAVAQ
jgi:hypothetical protein